MAAERCMRAARCGNVLTRSPVVLLDATDELVCLECRATSESERKTLERMVRQPANKQYTEYEYECTFGRNTEIVQQADDGSVASIR